MLHGSIIYLVSTCHEEQNHYTMSCFLFFNKGFCWITYHSTHVCNVFIKVIFLVNNLTKIQFANINTMNIVLEAQFKINQAFLIMESILLQLNVDAQG